MVDTLGFWVQGIKVAVVIVKYGSASVVIHMLVFGWFVNLLV